MVTERLFDLKQRYVTPKVTNLIRLIIMYSKDFISIVLLQLKKKNLCVNQRSEMANNVKQKQCSNNQSKSKREHTYH